MPNSQSELESKSEFPLTLAEVLFAELKSTRPDLDEEQPKITNVKAKLKQIEDLNTEEQVAQICERTGIVIKPTAETAHERIWDCRYELSKRLVPELYTIIRELPQMRSALCLSGGGVRSAIFNLGILQGLARCGLLNKFDYLSTVSGGGYIASWLTRWIHREGADKVIDELKRPPKSPLEPEPKPIYNLRVFSNFLTPKTGALSPDTWTMIATYLRNLFLNWLVFIPAIMTFLMLPRLWNSMWIGATNYGRVTQGGHLPVTLGLLGLAFGLVSLTGITLNLPTAFN